MNESVIKAKFILSKCKDCLGCNRIENRLFPGVIKCNYYRDARGYDLEKLQHGQQRNGIRKRSYHSQ